MDTPIEQQRAIYGTPLSERFGAVMGAYGLSQRGLAQILGLSAPMLSQLSSGRRIKIGNPAVYERLVMLEMRASEADLERVAREVQASEPVLTTGTGTPRPPAGPASLGGERPDDGAAGRRDRATAGPETLEILRRIASREQLAAVAGEARRCGAGELAALLEAAATP